MLRTDVAENLLDRAIKYVESKGPEFLRATTPAVQPYVEVYRKLGFKPLRRDFRLSWQIDDVQPTGDSRLEIEEDSDMTMDSAANTFVQAPSPYWDCRTGEEDGLVSVTQR